MRHILLVFLTGVSLAASAPDAPGQSSLSRPPTPAFALPPESITVTAAKPSDEMIKKFEETRASRPMSWVMAVGSNRDDVR